MCNICAVKFDKNRCSIFCNFLHLFIKIDNMIEEEYSTPYFLIARGFYYTLLSVFQFLSSGVVCIEPEDFKKKSTQ